MYAQQLDPTMYHADANIAHCQVVFLNYCEVSLYEIARITHYAISTVKSYISKYADLLNHAKEMFKPINFHNYFKEKELARKRALEEAWRKQQRKKLFQQQIKSTNSNWCNWYLNKKAKDANNYICFIYCVSFCDDLGNTIYHKIGTTGRPSLQKRLNELVKQYAYAGVTCYHIHKVIATPNRFAAETLEHGLQAYYWNHGATMIPQDRFIGMDFDFHGMWSDPLTRTLVQTVMKL